MALWFQACVVIVSSSWPLDPPFSGIVRPSMAVSRDSLIGMHHWHWHCERPWMPPPPQYHLMYPTMWCWSRARPLRKRNQACCQIGALVCAWQLFGGQLPSDPELFNSARMTKIQTRWTRKDTWKITANGKTSSAQTETHQQKLLFHRIDQ